jgi:hypothetical protein
MSTASTRRILDPTNQRRGAELAANHCCCVVVENGGCWIHACYCHLLTSRWEAYFGEMGESCRVHVVGLEKRGGGVKRSSGAMKGVRRRWGDGNG